MIFSLGMYVTSYSSNGWIEIYMVAFLCLSETGVHAEWG